MSSIKLTADSGGGTFEIKAPSSSGNTRVLTLPDTHNLTLNGGKILQVVSVSKGDKQSWTGTAKTEITNLAPTITPSSASNKILVLGTLYSSSNVASVTAYNVVERSINSGSFTTIGIHIDVSDSNSTQAHGHGGPFNGTWNLMNSSINFLDSPNTTNAIVYKWFMQSEGGTMYINRTGRNNTVYHPKTISVLTLMEIAA